MCLHGIVADGHHGSPVRERGVRRQLTDQPQSTFRSGDLAEEGWRFTFTCAKVIESRLSNGSAWLPTEEQMVRGTCGSWYDQLAALRLTLLRPRLFFHRFKESPPGRHPCSYPSKGQTSSASQCFTHSMLSVAVHVNMAQPAMAEKHTSLGFLPAPSQNYPQAMSLHTVNMDSPTHVQQLRNNRIQLI